MTGTLSDSKSSILDMNSKIISFLRFPLIVGVVIIHSACKSGNVLADSMSVLFSDIIAKVSVPCFFLISGYLFFVNIERLLYKQFVKKIRTRFKSLLIPYLIWIIIPIIILLIKNREFLSFSEILRMFWDVDSSTRTNLFGWPIKIAFPINGPLWFMRDLIILCILSPIIYYFIRFCKYWGIILLGGVYVFQIWPYITLESMSVFFFSLGSYLGVYKKSLVLEFKSMYIVTPLLVFACFFLYHTPYFNSLLSLYNIVAVFVVLMVASKCVSRNHHVEPSVAQSSMFVYVTHRIYIIGIIQSIVLPALFLHKTNSICLVSEYLLTPIVTVGICFVIFILLKKIVPTFLNYSLGGR